MSERISLYERWKEQMKNIEEKTGVKGIYVVIFLALCVFLVYLNIFDTVITNLLGTLYPAFWTIKSIENDQREEQKNWLTYWAVFGSFLLIDMFSPIIIKVLPFYFVLKIIFLIMLFMPGSKLGPLVYNILIKRIIGKYERDLDKALNKADELLKTDVNKSEIKKNKLKNLKNRDLDMDEALKFGQEIIDEKEKGE